MSRVIGVGNLSAAVAQLLEEYGQEAGKAIEAVAPAVAKKAQGELKDTSPTGSGRRHYADGWAIQRQNSKGGIRVVVHNRTKPGLTHLLEFGHANRDGGRTAPRPHIAAVNDRAQEEFIKRVEEALGK